MKDLQFKYASLPSIGRLLDEENRRQVAKWGVQDVTPFEWVTYLTEEVGELANAISEFEYRQGSMRHITKEAIQVATLALKIAEMYYFPEHSTSLMQIKDKLGSRI